MYGNGPLGKKPAGTFNFEPPPPGSALYLEPTPKRIRVEVEGETVADSRRAMLLHESRSAADLLLPARGRARPTCSNQPTSTPTARRRATLPTTRSGSGDRVVENAAWYYPDPLDDAPPPLKNAIAFYFDRVDRWLEEDEEIRVHPSDPYHRIDILAYRPPYPGLARWRAARETRRARWRCSSRTSRRAGTSRARTSSPSSSQATSSPAARTRAPRTTTRSGGHENLVWCYADPLPEVGRIKGSVAFFNEKVDIELDGELQERPESPWSKPLKSASSR